MIFFENFFFFDSTVSLHMATRRSKRNAARAARAAMASNVPSGNEGAEESSETEDEDCPELVVSDHSSDESSSSDEYDTDDEATLHGPCGERVCGADPPPKPLRTYLGQYVAKLFKIAGQEDDVLFWGEVVRYDPSSKRFSVRSLHNIYVYINTIKCSYAGQV